MDETEFSAMPPEMQKRLLELPFTIPVDLDLRWEPEDFVNGVPEAFQRSLMALAKDRYEADQGLPVGSFVFARYDEDRTPICSVLYTALKTCTERTKALFASFLRTAAEATEAIALAHVAEVWHFHGTDEELVGLRAWQAEHNGSYEGYAGVTEALSARFECAGDCVLWQAPISRDAAGKGSVGEWERGRYDSVRGRFVGLLSTANLEDRT